MFFSRKKEERSEEMKKLEQKNNELEEHLAEMRRRLARLEGKEGDQDQARGSGSKESALKEIYEDQLQQMFQKKLELEEKMGQVDKMMAEMEELERKKKEAPQIPPLMNAPNNWYPPNVPFYGNGPQGRGMPYPGPQGGGGMMFPPGPPMHSPGPFGGPVMPMQPMPPQPPTPPQPQPRGPPSFNQNRPRNNFQSNRGSAPPKRFNAPRNNQSPGNFSHQRKMNEESQGQDNKNFRPPQNRDENRTNDLGKSRPLFLNTDKNRSHSQPRNRGRADKGNPNNKDRGSEKKKECTESDNQKQVRTEPKGGRRRGSDNCQGKDSRNRNPNYNGPVDRRTVFKASSHKRGQGQHSRNTEDNPDSDDISDSSGESNSSGEESQDSQPVKSGQRDANRTTPDLVKIEKKKEENTSVEDKKDMDDKKKEEISGAEGKQKKKKKKNKPKGSKSGKGTAEEPAPLSKINLGENDILMKFIGTSIPSLLDAISLDISLNTPVSGVILMSNPNELKPILETPKTLFEIVNFKMKYPEAKSILL